MKFAKELEADLVPEWRAKYLDYKQGKKKLKAVARALQKVERSGPDDRRDSSPLATFGKAPFYAFLNRTSTRVSARRASSGDLGAVPSAAQHAEEGHGHTQSSSAMPIPGADDAERMPLQMHGEGRPMTRYGSILGSPPDMTSPPKAKRKSEDSGRSLRLPGPAMDTPSRRSVQRQKSSGSAYQVGENTSKHPSFSLPSRYRSVFQPKRVNSMPGVQDAQPTRPPTRRMFSGFRSSSPNQDDIALEAYREIDVRQTQFFMFLDQEMDKVETFYKSKEDEATERLKVMREQLHVMRDQRAEELLYATSRTKYPSHNNDFIASGMVSRNSTLGGEESQLIKKNGNMKNGWAKAVNGIQARKRGPQAGKTFEAMQHLSTPSAPRPMDQSRDYIRRGGHPEVPYRTAKRKLKIALAEYYRGLELLKSYALLNRTAFRKINKKFDKTVNARPSGRYMNEKVNKAYFVNSTIIDGHIQAVEDMYARYFERGNHKIAVGKLRAKVARLGDYTGSVFRNGVLLATGCVFGIEGLVYGTQLLWDDDPQIASETSYLLQIYGGYFLMWFLALLFCGACRVWTRAKVNYSFIFEFDTRHSVDWRQLTEIPAVLGLCLGIIMWLNFKRFTDDSFYIWWPVVLVCVSGLILFAPLPIFYHRSRGWFAYSNYRLLLAGVFPVEFRDFFLGDMFCSQTYALGNIELFFCLYANDWINPAQCNSSHSRLLGFFTTLPGIWRALQCLRRYADTRSLFPHMANFGKYMCTILYYMSLSLWRHNKTPQLRILFIFWATINGVYTSVWDIFMDWSLMDPYAKHRFLRNTLGFKYAWWYYAAIVIDPIIRFNWIFYAIYGHDVQHSTIVSFLVAFTEVLRRGMWQLFRVENEHCTNVTRYRASRDVPLPYALGKTEAEAEVAEEAQGKHSSDLEAQQPSQLPPDVAPSIATGADPSRRSSNADPASGSIRQRRKPGSTNEASPLVRAITRVGTLLRASHAQDFERRRKSELPNTLEGEDDDDDDSDEENEATIDEDERDGSHHRRQLKKERNGNGKAPEQTGDEDEDEDDEEVVGSGSGSGSGSGGEAGASSVSDDQEIAAAKVLRQAR